MVYMIFGVVTDYEISKHDWLSNIFYFSIS